MAKNPSSGSRRRPSVLLWILLVLVLLIAGAAFFFLRTFVFTGGHLYRRDAERLDLRADNISYASYEKLRTELPDCEILCGIPIGGRYYDNTAESLTVPFAPAEELNRFAAFTALRELDITGTDLTAAQYEELFALLPECVIRWSVPFGGRSASDAKSISVSDFSSGDISLLSYFTELEQVDASGCSCLAELLAASHEYPQISFLWTVPLSGGSYAQDTTALSLSGVGYAELSEKLKYLPALGAVTVEGNALSEDEQLALEAEYPNIAFTWEVTLFGRTVSTGCDALDLTGLTLTEADLGTLTAALPRFAALESVDLTGCGLSNEALFALCDSFPELDILWEFELFGRTVSTADTFWDFTGIRMDNFDALEAVFPYMHRLEKVDLTDCGREDEQIDALNKKYENIRVVWTLYIRSYKIRTDATWFIGCLERHGDFNETTIHKLAYCTDMVALDLGHRTVPSLDFLYSMPHVKYLILLHCTAMDATPISSLKELVHMEFDCAYRLDVSQLSGCTALEDLNIAFSGLTSRQGAVETLCGMTSLKMLWVSRAQFTDADIAVIQEALPECKIGIVYYELGIYQGGWRTSPNYYDMRDFMDMYYFDDDGRIVDYKIVDGEMVRVDKKTDAPLPVL